MHTQLIINFVVVGGFGSCHIHVVERSRPQVLVAVEPRLLGDSLSLALDRTGEWDIRQLHQPGRPPTEQVDAVIITTGVASVVRSDIVIELPDELLPGRDGFVEIHGHRHPANLPTISAIIEVLRRAEEELDSDAPRKRWLSRLRRPAAIRRAAP